MVGCVVVDQKNFFPNVGAGEVVEERRVSLTIEHLFSMDEMNPRPTNVHGTENFLRVALAGRGDSRLVPAPGPSLVQSRVLAETRFVGEQQRGTQISGFFLAWDRCSAASDPAKPDRLWPGASGGVGLRSLNL